MLRASYLAVAEAGALDTDVSFLSHEKGQNSPFLGSLRGAKNPLKIKVFLPCNNTMFEGGTSSVSEGKYGAFFDVPRQAFSSVSQKSN